MNKDMKKLATLVGASLAASVSVTTANANENPFELNDMSEGYQVVSFLGDKGKEGKCGEGKKGKEGKCGEGKCGEGKKGKEGKCGEGKCGEDKKGKKGKEGKCGEGKCGA
jgi:uncharacterized low-complexity protein